MIATDDLRARVESFPRWHYELDLNGVRTPIFDPAHVNRHRQRKAYFFDPLVELCGGSLEGKRVLDLGCNAGFWSLSAVEAGADFVLGVDGREMHVDQAQLVFEAKGVDRDRYRFEAADVFELDLSDEEPFDVVLCLGLLYHVRKPFELFERISAWNTDLLAIDTAICSWGGEFFRIVQQDLDEPRSAADRAVALHPSGQAVTRLAQESGYGEAVMLRPRFTSWEGSRSYKRGRRRAFMCSKHTPLDGLDAEPVKVRGHRRHQAAAAGTVVAEVAEARRNGALPQRRMKETGPVAPVRPRGLPRVVRAARARLSAAAGRTRG